MKFHYPDTRQLYQVYIIIYNYKIPFSLMEPPASAPNVAELQGEEQHDTSSMDVTLPVGRSARVDSGNIASPFAPCGC